MKTSGLSAVTFFLALFWALPAFAFLPDRYVCDSAIYYGGQSSLVKPNVLFLIDSSIHMANYKGGTAPYDPAVDYSFDPSGTKKKDQYDKHGVYTINNQGNYNFQFSINVVDCGDAKESLEKYGTFFGALRTSGNQADRGKCDTGNNPKPEYFFLGNYINFLKTDPVVTVWQAETEYDLGDIAKPSALSSDEYIVANAGTSGSSAPTWPIEAATPVQDGSVVWELRESFLVVTKELLKTVADQIKSDVKLGIMVYGSANKGGQVLSPVIDVESDTNNTFFIQADKLPDHVLSSGTARPINEALFDAMIYFMGKDHTNEKVANNNTSNHGTPIEYHCQKSHVIIITTGSSFENNNKVKNLVGGSGYVTDVAKYAYQTDLLPQMPGKQILHTNVIQLATPKDALLEQATELGRGVYAQANNSRELEEAVKGILSGIVRQRDTAFVAPVVPAAPENRAFSGDRIYVGFFYPREEGPWWGNLMKFGLSSKDGELKIVDKKNQPATDSQGNFILEAVPFWGQDMSGDDDDVDSILKRGGAGSVLQAAEPAARNIFTFTGGSKDLVADANRFSDVSADALDVTASERTNLIQFIQGYDAFDYDSNPPNRPWIMGDILHSRPLVVRYAGGSYIYVGSNGGMLHAFKDDDGSEEWAFIPPSLLPRLQYLNDPDHHAYFVDGTPSIYLHDADGSGVIGTSGNDLAILIFGLRRGGGWQDLESTAPHGTYYALDVTDPKAPKYLWSINNKTTGFERLTQTWSQPHFGRVNVEGKRKVVAFFGGGYDNVEDLRFGSTQNHPPSPKQTGPTSDFISGKSDDGGANETRRGYEIYAIEIATLGHDGTVFKPNLNSSGSLVWSFIDGCTENGVMRADCAPEYSIPSDVLVLDRNGNGFADRLYVGDMGGNIWRVDLTKGNVENKVNKWKTRKIFSANPGIDPESAATNGRKIFFRPDATILNNRDVMLFFGTGDRAHPLNYKNPGPDGATIDRIYAIRDSDYYDGTTLTEDDLVDVTKNELQREDTTDAQRSVIMRQLSGIADPQNGKVHYGWYIRLDVNAGEKVLAPPSLFNNIAFFTTYQPFTVEQINNRDDPCEVGNMGTARLYAVDASTGKAVFNFYDQQGTDQYGESQDTADGPVLRRADRELALGSGIPSGIVFVVSEEGDVWAITSVDMTSSPLSLGMKLRPIPLYWVQW